MQLGTYLEFVLAAIRRACTYTGTNDQLKEEEEEHNDNGGKGEVHGCLLSGSVESRGASQGDGLLIVVVVSKS